jgi:hypothetical protein
MLLRQTESIGTTRLKILVLIPCSFKRFNTLCKMPVQGILFWPNTNKAFCPSPVASLANCATQLILNMIYVDTKNVNNIALYLLNWMLCLCCDSFHTRWLRMPFGPPEACYVADPMQKFLGRALIAFSDVV